MDKKKGLYDYKLGEYLDKEVKLFNELFKHPIRLVAIGYTFQDAEGSQMETKLKHESFIEIEDEDNINSFEDE
jgi:hypothetical protein